MFAVAFPPSQGDRRPPSCLISLCIKFETSNQNHTWVSGSALLFPYRAAPLSIHGHSLLSVAQTIHLGGHTDSSLIPHIQAIGKSRWLGLQNAPLGTSLEVRGLRLRLPIQAVRVQSLVRELGSRMPCSQTPKT